MNYERLTLHTITTKSASISIQKNTETTTAHNSVLTYGKLL